MEPDNEDKLFGEIGLDIQDPDHFEQISDRIKKALHEINHKAEEIGKLIAETVNETEKYASQTYDGMNMSKILTGFLYKTMSEAQDGCPRAKSQNYYVIPAFLWDKMEKYISITGNEKTALQIRHTLGSYFIGKGAIDCL